MAMLLHLRGLPEQATSQDIRDFFRGYDIPYGGIIIPIEGNAFIKFGGDEDLLKATTKDGAHLLGHPVTLLLCTEDDKKKVIENASRTTRDETFASSSRGSYGRDQERSMDYEVDNSTGTNLPDDKQSFLSYIEQQANKGDAYRSRTTEQEPQNDGSFYLEVGPIDSTIFHQDIKTFFGSLGDSIPPDGIVMGRSRNPPVAFVKFESGQDFKVALMMDGRKMVGRVVTVRQAYATEFESCLLTSIAPTLEYGYDFTAPHDRHYGELARPSNRVSSLSPVRDIPSGSSYYPADHRGYAGQIASSATQYGRVQATPAMHQDSLYSTGRVGSGSTSLTFDYGHQSTQAKTNIPPRQAPLEVPPGYYVMLDQLPSWANSSWVKWFLGECTLRNELVYFVTYRSKALYSFVSLESKRDVYKACGRHGTKIGADVLSVQSVTLEKVRETLKNIPPHLTLQTSQAPEASTNVNKYGQHQGLTNTGKRSYTDANDAYRDKRTNYGAEDRSQHGQRQGPNPRGPHSSITPSQHQAFGSSHQHGGLNRKERREAQREELQQAWQQRSRDQRGNNKGDHNRSEGRVSRWEPQQAPTKQAPTIQGPSKQVPTIQGPSKQVPTIQGPSKQVPPKQAPSKQAPTIQGPSKQVPTKASNMGNVGQGPKNIQHQPTLSFLSSDHGGLSRRDSQQSMKPGRVPHPRWSDRGEFKLRPQEEVLEVEGLNLGSKLTPEDVIAWLSNAPNKYQVGQSYNVFTRPLHDDSEDMVDVVEFKVKVPTKKVLPEAVFIKGFAATLTQASLSKACGMCRTFGHGRFETDKCPAYSLNENCHFLVGFVELALSPFNTSCSLHFKGRKHLSIEHAYMWAQAHELKRPDLAKEIMGMKDIQELKSRSAKNHAKAIHYYKALNWEKDNYQLLKDLCMIKYEKSEEFRKALLETEDKLIFYIHGSPTRGIGIKRLKKMENMHPSYFAGMNLYGKALMEVRKVGRVKPVLPKQIVVVDDVDDAQNDEGEVTVSENSAKDKAVDSESEDGDNDDDDDEVPKPKLRRPRLTAEERLHQTRMTMEELLLCEGGGDETIRFEGLPIGPKCPVHVVTDYLMSDPLNLEIFDGPFVKTRKYKEDYEINVVSVTVQGPVLNPILPEKGLVGGYTAKIIHPTQKKVLNCRYCLYSTHETNHPACKAIRLNNGTVHYFQSNSNNELSPNCNSSPVKYEGHEHGSVVHAFVYKATQELGKLGVKGELSYTNGPLHQREPLFKTNKYKCMAWEAEQLDLWKDLYRIKWESSPAFRQALADTRDMTIVFIDNRLERGTGYYLKKSAWAYIDPACLPGLNLVGKALMAIREEKAGDPLTPAPTTQPRTDVSEVDAIQTGGRTMVKPMSLSEKNGAAMVAAEEKTIGKAVISEPTPGSTQIIGKPVIYKPKPGPTQIIGKPVIYKPKPGSTQITKVEGPIPKPKPKPNPPPIIAAMKLPPCQPASQSVIPSPVPPPTNVSGSVVPQMYLSEPKITKITSIPKPTPPPITGATGLPPFHSASQSVIPGPVPPPTNVSGSELPQMYLSEPKITKITSIPKPTPPITEATALPPFHSASQSVIPSPVPPPTNVSGSVVPQMYTSEPKISKTTSIPKPTPPPITGATGLPPCQPASQSVIPSPVPPPTYTSSSMVPQMLDLSEPEPKPEVKVYKTPNTYKLPPFIDLDPSEDEEILEIEGLPLSPDFPPEIVISWLRESPREHFIIGRYNVIKRPHSDISDYEVYVIQVKLRKPLNPVFQKSEIINGYVCKMIHASQSDGNVCIACRQHGHTRQDKDECPAYTDVFNIHFVENLDNIELNPGCMNGPVEYEGYTHLSVNHAYLWKQAVDLGRPDIAEMFKEARRTADIRKIWTQLHFYESINWELRNGHLLKELFKQRWEKSRAFRTSLRSTGNQEIKYIHTRISRGVGVTGLKRVQCMKPEYYPGLNMVGQVLMELRIEMRNWTNKPMKPILPIIPEPVEVGQDSTEVIDMDLDD